MPWLVTKKKYLKEIVYFTVEMFVYRVEETKFSSSELSLVTGGE